jgi:hypothetical protein
MLPELHETNQNMNCDRVTSDLAPQSDLVR